MFAYRRRALSLFACALLCWLGIGALKARQNLVTRGISPDMPEPIVGSGVQLGIVVDLSQYDQDELPAELERIADAGITHLRQTFHYVPDFDWEQSARLISAVNNAGLTLTPLLDGDPQNQFAPPADPAKFAQWSGDFAQRFGERLDAYIIWDEPNLAEHWGGLPANPAEYGALLAASAAEIRRADPAALIIAAPLAPTADPAPENMADPLFLQRLYEAGAAGAFDVVAGKPYGFDYPPSDRTVDWNKLNFSRIILLRETMVANGDAGKAIWAGNWGWNALPATWQGDNSIWGESSAEDQAAWTQSAFDRARLEWDWMGVMFLESWQPNLPQNDPGWGFAIKDSLLEDTLQTNQASNHANAIAYPGFHLADKMEASQRFQGNWRFSPEFGADISQTGDAGSFVFYGTEIAMRVRRADYRARFYLEIDGQPANAVPPTDDGRATLILTAEDQAEDYVTNEIVAANLPLGVHTLTFEAYRGWDQWALHGFSVAARPPTRWTTAGMWGLALLSAALLAGAWRNGKRADLGAVGATFVGWWRRLPAGRQLALSGITAMAVGLSGWLTWGAHAAGIYRRLNDLPGLALTAASASIFYFAPTFIVYILALAALCLLLSLRPARGIALVAFCLPFYVTPKPMLGYRFSPVEIFILAAFVGSVLAWFWRRAGLLPASPQPNRGWKMADWAVAALLAASTLSLFFTERLDVATNEWRVIILEPVLFYFVIRQSEMEPADIWLIFDALILGAATMALYGLWEFGFGADYITAELGVRRLRSVYGSPNNVALYLGRIIPMLAGVILWRAASQTRRLWYAIAGMPILLAAILTVSKGWLFLGMPAAALTLIILWNRDRGKKPWKWLAATGFAGIIIVIVLFQIPQLAARLNPQGSSGFLRLNLWRASWTMWMDNLVFGVGHDNFLYEYRGRYMLDAAWKEPDLSHPHNIFLDFAARLGTVGLAAGIFLFGSFFNALQKLRQVDREWAGVIAGMWGAMAYSVAHGLVDHSFFLVDLAAFTLLLLGVSIQLSLIGCPES